MPGINGTKMVVTFDVATGTIDSVTNENGNPDNGRPGNSNRPAEATKEVFSSAALTTGANSCFTFIYNGREYTVCI